MTREYQHTYFSKRSATDPAFRRYKQEWQKKWRAANILCQANWAARTLGAIKHRAKMAGVPFDLTPRDVYVPTHCPIFGTQFVFGGPKGHPCAPSIDRIRPRLGYVKGNIAVISRRANMIKQDATAAEIQAVAAWAADQGA